MLPSRTGTALLSALALAACGVAETAPPPVAVAPAGAEEPADSAAEPAPPPEPEPSLQERWRAPFAVASRGRPAPRPERVVFVRAAETPAPRVVAAPTEEEEDAPESAPAAERPVESPAPAPRASRPEPRAEPEGARTHKVEWGETWYGIARRYGIPPSALERANPEANPERIRSGQVLRIPSAAAAAEGQRTHEVGRGDSLWGIARRYGVTMEQIRAANRLKDDRVRLGQTLIIPGAEEKR